MDRKQAVFTYSPESSLARPLTLLKNIFRDLWQGKEIAWRIFIRNIKARYKQSLLGVAWAFLTPLGFTITWLFLKRSGVLNMGEPDIPAPLYILCGIILWQSFVEALQAPIKVIDSNRQILTKINFIRESLFLAAFAEVLFNLAIKSLLLLFMFLFLGYFPPATLLISPIPILLLIFFGFSLGTFLVPVGALYGDISRALTIIATLWFLITPVVYKPVSGLAVKVTQYNPVTPLLQLSRDLMCTGTFTFNNYALAIIILSVILMLIALVMTRVALPHLLIRLGF